jgi:predicted metal-dependent peptidase
LKFKARWVTLNGKEKLMTQKHSAHEAQKKTTPKTNDQGSVLNEAIMKLREYNAQPNDEEFQRLFVSILMQEPFLSTMALSINRCVDNTMPTAYVGVQRDGTELAFVLGYNSDFMRSLTREVQLGVIKHELYHLVFNHITSRGIGDKRMAKLWNIATDLAINSIIGKDHLPKVCLIPGQRPMDMTTGKPAENKVADYIAKAKPMQASDLYFEQLKEVLQEELNKGEAAVEIALGGLGEMDDHSGWGDLPAEIEEQLRESIREIVSEAVKKCDRSNSWGSVPAEMQEYIRKMLSNEVDWRSIVKNFLGRCRTTDRLATVKRINKKVPYAHPGVKRKTVATFACFIDQSGSVGDQDLELFFGELGSFSRETQLDVYHFDTDVDEQSHTVWRKNGQVPKPKRTRCGGTDFDAVGRFVNRSENQGKWSGIVILTDGYAPKLGLVKGAKVLWVITESGDAKSAIRSGDLVCQMKRAKSFQRH